eukprot:COSAG02_NODE_2799_length_8009_cov_10.033375_5_plen_68_part_00
MAEEDAVVALRAELGATRVPMQRAAADAPGPAGTSRLLCESPRTSRSCRRVRDSAAGTARTFRDAQR